MNTVCKSFDHYDVGFEFFNYKSITFSECFFFKLKKKMSFPLGEKDKSNQPSNSKETDTRRNPLESITDPIRRDEIERGGMIMGPHHPGFRSESQEMQQNDVQTSQLRLPQGSVPPGARFDPIVPDDQTRPDQYGHRPIAGPDNDELLPPGQEAPKVKQQIPSKVKPPTFQDSTKRTGEGFERGNFSGGGGFPF